MKRVRNDTGQRSPETTSKCNGGLFYQQTVSVRYMKRVGGKHGFNFVIRPRVL